ncbi:hypothetical protein G9A89_023718 [Geosiphon pyriformis]|nr:hypothetical protein G9A89_023718 [Geosiphon pyriformis]
MEHPKITKFENPDTSKCAQVNLSLNHNTIFPNWVVNRGKMGEDEGDLDVCRVCRSEGTADQPLFHPCKCAGSIRFVHQDCLTEWLKHSKKKHCEVCKYPFSFTPIYDPRMPDSIPIVLFIRRGLRRFYGLVKIWLRAMLVGTVWLITLPYITVWVWRFYFWSGESLASFVYGIKPATMETNNNTMTEEKSTLAIFYVTLLKGALWYVPPDAVEFLETYGDFASKFFADTFHGQIITCIVVIVFVAAFLLREWIIQNTPPEDGLENDVVGIEGIDHEILENNAVENNARRQVIPDIPPAPIIEREFDIQFPNIPQLANFDPVPNLPQLPQLPNINLPALLNLPLDPPALNNRPWPVLNIPPPVEQANNQQIIPLPPAGLFNEANLLLPRPQSQLDMDPANQNEQLELPIPTNREPFIGPRPTSQENLFRFEPSNFSQSFTNIRGMPIPGENIKNTSSNSNQEDQAGGSIKSTSIQLDTPSSSLLINSSPPRTPLYVSYPNDKNVSALMDEVERNGNEFESLLSDNLHVGSSRVSTSDAANVPLSTENVSQAFLFNGSTTPKISSGGIRTENHDKSDFRTIKASDKPSTLKQNIVNTEETLPVTRDQAYMSRRIRPIKHISMRARTSNPSIASSSNALIERTFVPSQGEFEGDSTSLPSSITSETSLRWDRRVQEPFSKDEFDVYDDSPVSSGEISSEENIDDNPAKRITFAESSSSKDGSNLMARTSDFTFGSSRQMLPEKSWNSQFHPDSTLQPTSNWDSARPSWAHNPLPDINHSSCDLNATNSIMPEDQSEEHVDSNILNFDEEEEENSDEEAFEDSQEGDSDDGDNREYDERDPDDIINVGGDEHGDNEDEQQLQAEDAFAPHQEMEDQPRPAVDPPWVAGRDWIANLFNDAPEQNNNNIFGNQPPDQDDDNNAVAPIVPLPPEDFNQNQPAAPVIPPLPAPLFNEAIEAPAGGFQAFLDPDEEEEENVANEDLEGVLEAIGMRGSLWMLLQNSALMALLIALCLAGSIWVPYIVGKIALLSNPLSLIQWPLWLLRCITDPFVDLILDTMLPWIWSLVSSILKSGWEVTSPAIIPYLEHSNALEPFQIAFSKSWEYFLYALSLTTHIAPETEKITTNMTTALNTDHQISEFLKVHHVNIAFSFMRRYNEFAYGNKPLDKIVCILFGYTIVILLCTWYLARTRNAYGRTVGRAVQEALRQQGIVLKVAFFVAIELAIFPIICGILLDLSTLPLFPDATPLTRLNFYLESPITSIFLHWFIGTGFMFHFAVFVSLCREIVRPGVMWFIRDPNDPQFHPIKEILERPVWTQLKKIGASGIMYSAMIVLGLGSVIYFVRYCFSSILPLRWSFNEPISDFPLDLLIFHIIVPITVDWAKPRRLFRSLFTNWWKVAAGQLRLTSFMFGNRHPEEEGTHVRKTWRAFLLARKAPIPRLGIDINVEDNQDAEVVFIKDGGFVRAPSYDGVPVVPGRRMLIPVNEQGALLDPNDAPVGDDGQLHHTVVYIPPSFRSRVIFFLFLMWFCGSVFCCSVTILPLLIGRFIFKAILHYQKPVHDLYALTVGLYGMWSAGVGFEWILRKVQILKEQQLGNVNWPELRRKLTVGTIVFLKILYLFFAFGIVMPFLFSLVIELYFIFPWKKYNSDKYQISLMQDWALGVVYMKIAYRIVFMLPDNTFSRAINEITGRGIRNLDVKLATRMFIPIGGMAIGAVILPAINAYFILLVAGIRTQETKSFIFKLIYPLFLAFVVGYRIQRQATQLIQNWMQTVRDEEYLIGRQLHNIEPNDPGLGRINNGEIVI